MYVRENEIKQRNKNMEKNGPYCIPKSITAINILVYNLVYFYSVLYICKYVYIF